MAEWDIPWKTLTKVPAPEAPVLTGDTQPASAEAPAPAPANERPLFVWVFDPTSDPKTDKIESVIFEDDRISLGARAFTCVKISADDAKNDPILQQKAGKEIPRLVFFSADMKSVKAVEAGQLKIGEVWSSMKTVANKHYAQDIETVVKGVKETLIEFDKVNKERKALDDKEKRAQEKGMNAQDKKEIDAKRAELDAREKKAKEQKDKLWELKTKLPK